MKRTALFTTTVSLWAAPLFAQAAAPDGAAAARKAFTEVSGWIAKAADAVPADKYTYKPAATVRTFGQLVAHMADGYVYFCNQAAGKNTQWSDAIEKGKTDKVTVVAALKQAQATCTSAYASGRSHR